MLRPFFGQCIFNIIFAAPAYPVSLLLSASSASLPFPLSCCGRNFFRFFIFWSLLFFTILPLPSAHSQQPCLQWACMYFFHIRRLQSPGGWSPPIGNCPVCRWPRCICEMLSTLLYFYLPLPPSLPQPPISFLTVLLLFFVFTARCGG